MFLSSLPIIININVHIVGTLAKVYHQGKVILVCIYSMRKYSLLHNTPQWMPEKQRVGQRHNVFQCDSVISYLPHFGITSIVIDYMYGVLTVLMGVTHHLNMCLSNDAKPSQYYFHIILETICLLLMCS